MRITAKSLVLDLLSTLGAGSMPVRGLVAAAEMFAIDGNAVRVAVTRLVAEGLVKSDERGAYWLGPAAKSVSSQVSGWRTLEDRTRKWDGAWIGAVVSSLPRSERTAMRSTERALRFLGFRPLAPGFALRPDNLAGGVAATRERLHTLGLDARVSVIRVDDLDADSDARARSLWDAEDLAKRYRRLHEKLERSSGRLESLSPSKAMAESFSVGGATIRALVLDPLLPEPIVPVQARRRLLEAMRNYDRLGRRIWAPFMKSHGALQSHAPHHLRAIDAWNTALASSSGATA